ncbi:hypothetical protein GCM10009605_26800 [Nocardiopsis composta]
MSPRTAQPVRIRAGTIGFSPRRAAPTRSRFHSASPVSGTAPSPLPGPRRCGAPGGGTLPAPQAGRGGGQNSPVSARPVSTPVRVAVSAALVRRACGVSA